MYLERLADAWLLKWKNEAERKPLLLRGARQVGKTSAVRHLAESFANYVEIDFNERVNLHKLFEGEASPSEICGQLSVLLGKPIVEGETLLFFDEIQACPAAINKLRYFREQKPSLHVIAAGSLLEFALQALPSFGVGRVRSLFMYSFCFEEFLRALGEGALAEAILKASPAEPLPVLLHERALVLLREFLVLGGMPEVVASYAEHRDKLACQTLLDDLLLSYEDDFRKYGAKVSPQLLRQVLTSVALQGQGKFVYSRVGEGQKAAHVRQALELLSMAGLVHPVTRTAANGVPLMAEADESYQRFIYMDTGLLQRALRLDLANILLESDFKLVNKGALAETFVGTELVKAAPPTAREGLYCWHREKSGSNAEVDYVINRGGEVCPIEVKAGSRGAMQSLRIFLEAKRLGTGIRTSLEPFGTFQNIQVYPLYAIGNLVK